MPGVEVSILGQKYTIKGDAPEDHIRKLADYIDANINEILSKFPGISPMNVLILATFNMADEVHRLRKDNESIGRDIREKVDLLAGLFE